MSGEQTRPTSEATSRHNFSRVAIVGAATLKGRELKDVLEERRFPALDVRLLDDEESLGQLEAVGDEVSFIQSVRAEHFQNVDVAFFACEAAFTRSHWQMARRQGCAIVDTSYALEDVPGAELRAPWLEVELGRMPAPTLASDAALAVVAHPAAIVLALLMTRAQRAGDISVSAATLFEPASEQGRKGMDELHQQTVNLLSFQSLPRQIFDSQIAFNLLPRYGAQAASNLDATERRIAQHFRAIMRPQVPAQQPVRHAFVAAGRAAGETLIDQAGVAGSSANSAPALTLLQAPIFHSHAFSIYLEWEREISGADLAKSLAGEHVSVVDVTEEAQSNVSAAGQNEIQVGWKRDLNHPNGMWLFAVADNLKITALNAVACAEAAVAMRPKGPVQ
jgi:aspartate-semialdehyde dehydrogenase